MKTRFVRNGQAFLKHPFSLVLLPRVKSEEHWFTVTESYGPFSGHRDRSRSPISGSRDQPQISNQHQICFGHGDHFMVPVTNLIGETKNRLVMKTLFWFL